MKFINKILIIYVYNQNSGLGHFKRMKSLHSVFRRSKFFCDLKKVRNNSDLKKINVRKYQKILIDINFRAKEIINIFKKNKKKVYTFDYFFNDKQDINFSVFEQKKNLTGVRFSGFKFAIISKDFKKKRRKLRLSNDSVAIFGGEKFFISATKIYNFSKKTKLKFSFFSNNKRFFKSKIKFIKREELNQKISEFKYCITNCGISLLESLYLKKLIFVCPQTKYEKKFSNYLIQKSYVLGNLNQKFISLNKQKISSVRKKISNLIDGKGDERIVKIITNHDI